MIAAAPAPALPVTVDPGFAEDLVRRMLRSGDEEARAALRRHAARVEPLYAIGDRATRDSAFGRTALVEFEELGLGDRIRLAVMARPMIAERVRQVLLAEARGRVDEGVTWEPSGAHLGIRVEASRFDRPDRLDRWLHHVLGHAQDTLDPAFGYVPGRTESVLSTPAQARFHRLWDVMVDAVRPDRVAVGDDAGAHRASVAADMPGVPDDVLDAVLARLAGPPRPTFDDLLCWAADRTLLITAATGGPLEDRRDRCPLCGFPGIDIVPPGPAVAGMVLREYPDWRPELGLCGRCGDRYRLAGHRGGRA